MEDGTSGRLVCHHRVPGNIKTGISKGGDLEARDSDSLVIYLYSFRVAPTFSGDKTLEVSVVSFLQYSGQGVSVFWLGATWKLETGIRS